eukprot:3359527-Pyramimonas_sp.AAC.1
MFHYGGGLHADSASIDRRGMGKGSRGWSVPAKPRTSTTDKHGRYEPHEHSNQGKMTESASMPERTCGHNN